MHDPLHECRAASRGGLPPTPSLGLGQYSLGYDERMSEFGRHIAFANGDFWVLAAAKLPSRKRPVAGRLGSQFAGPKQSFLGAIIPVFPSPIGNFGNEHSGTDCGKGDAPDAYQRDRRATAPLWVPNRDRRSLNDYQPIARSGLKRSTTLAGAAAPKNTSKFRADRCAMGLLRGNRAAS